jgi:hypothetical protein
MELGQLWFFDGLIDIFTTEGSENVLFYFVALACSSSLTTVMIFLKFYIQKLY